MPFKGGLKLSIRKMHFLRLRKWTNQAREPINPHLVAYKGCPADVFILIKGKLEILPSG